jgi:hypothetical protein
MLILTLFIIAAEPLLRYLYPNFDEMDEAERDEILEKVALRLPGFNYGVLSADG